MSGIAKMLTGHSRRVWVVRRHVEIIGVFSSDVDAHNYAASLPVLNGHAAYAVEAWMIR